MPYPHWLTRLITWLTGSHDPKRNPKYDIATQQTLHLEPFAPLPTAGYLVGGAVRDMLLGHTPKDSDWLVPDPHATAIQAAEALAGSLFAIDERRNVWRVVHNVAGQPLVRDYVPLETDLITDLNRRDFTINAIAVDLAGNVLDPLNGRQDLMAQTVRMVAATNLHDDPLRLLRGVRFVCQLGFRLDDESHRTLREVARLHAVAALPLPAWERIRDELDALLMTPRAASGVWLLAELGALEHYLPELVAGQGITQGSFHHMDVFDHSVEALRQLLLGFPDASLALRWGTLLHDIGKPPCFDIDPDTGKQRFYGHDKVGADMTKTLLRRLRQPNTLVHHASQLVRYHMLPLPTTPKTTRRFVHRRREILPDLLKVMLADREAARGKRTSFAARQAYRRAIASILAELDKPAPPEPLLTGNEVMTILGLEPGPKIGQALQFVAEARAVGDVSNPKDAKNALLTYAKQQGWTDVAHKRTQ